MIEIGLAFFLVVATLIGSINPNNSNTLSRMKHPIIIEAVYGNGYLIKDGTNTTILLDSDKKKYEFLKNFEVGDTLEIIIDNNNNNDRKRNNTGAL